jgi:hypothetical protein
MPRACTICTHAQKTTIDRDLDEHTSYRTIAERYHISKSALLRHQEHRTPETNHVSDQVPDHVRAPCTCPCTRLNWSELARETQSLNHQMQAIQDPYRAVYCLRYMAGLLAKLTAAACESKVE